MKEDKRFKDPKNKGKIRDQRRNTEDKDYRKTPSTPKGYNSANDFKWYFQNPQVARDAASIQFANVLGLSVDQSFTNAADPSEQYVSKMTLPGIMNISYVPVAGVSTEGVADINVAARLIYAYVRHANSGSRNYEASDLMTYLLAMGNAYAYYSELVKVYGLLNTTSILNRYVAKPLLTSAGYNYDELVNNMADFRAFINWFAVKLNTFAVPKDMYLFDRWTFLPLNVYTDGVGSKIQFYNFIPRIIYKWSGTETGGSALIADYYSHASLESIKTFGKGLINALLDNEDIGIMSGDVLKSFKESGLRVVGGVEDQYSASFLRDEGVLSQIHNMTIAPGSIDTSALKITQDNNVLVCQPYVRVSDFENSTYIPKDVMLDTWLEDPNPEAVMEMTRLCSIWSETGITGEDEKILKCTTCGSELVFEVTISYLDNFGQVQSEALVTYYDSMSGDGLISERLMSLITKFDWAPYIYYASDEMSIAPIGDAQNYTLINASRLSVIHDVALQSLLNVYGLYIKAF